MCGEVILASFLSPNLATQSAADSCSAVPVAELDKPLGLGAYVTYESYHLSAASRPHWTEAAGTRGRHFPIPSLRVSNRKNTKAGGPIGPSRSFPIQLELVAEPEPQYQ